MTARRYGSWQTLLKKSTGKKVILNTGLLCRPILFCRRPFRLKGIIEDRWKPAKEIIHAPIPSAPASLSPDSCPNDSMLYYTPGGWKRAKAYGTWPKPFLGF
jgi:hypothetical protein